MASQIRPSTKKAHCTGAFGGCQAFGTMWQRPMVLRGSMEYGRSEGGEANEGGEVGEKGSTGL
eukprot:10558153-Prorocentrum_lima.AAC.1